MLFAFFLFVFSLSALFLLQILAEVIWLFAGQVYVLFLRLHGACEDLQINYFYSETKICKCEISWISLLSFISPLNYCWNGFLKAANDKRFL